MTPSAVDLARVKYELLLLEPEALALIGRRVSPVPSWKSEEAAIPKPESDDHRYDELHRRYRAALARAATSFFVGALWGIIFGCVLMIVLIRSFA